MTLDPVALLSELVAIDSTSSRSNSPVVDVLARRARALGFETRRLAWSDAAGVRKEDLVARRGPDRAGGLALVGHTDCVPFDAAWKEALTPVVREGRLYARGAADTKSFIACALAAASRASNTAEPLWLVFTADEEVGCLGAKKLVEEGTLRPARAVVGEPTELTPVRAHKGYCLAEVEVTGVEGHSAYPEVGASAIVAASRLIAAIDALARPGGALAAEADPLFAPPHTTVNVGLVEGGKAKNVIAGRCRFTLEWRPIPGQEVRRALSLVEAAAAEVARGFGGRVQIAIAPSRLDAGVATREGAEIVSFLEAQSGRRAATIPFGTELPQLAQLGAEACVFGPGDIKVAHRTGEFVPLDEVARATDVLAKAIERFA